MLVAAALGGNVVERHVVIKQFLGAEIPLKGRGWPAVFQEWSSNEPTNWYQFQSYALAFNITVDLVGLLFIAIGLELIYRRRDRARTPAAVDHS